MHIPSLKKFTIHNIVIKWPRIILGNFGENHIRYSRFWGGILFTGKPVILTDIYNMRFVLYPWDHVPLEKLLSRRYLAREYQAISRIIKKGDLIIDAGANIGTHSIYMSRLIGQTGKIYAFEPVPNTYWQLRENLGLNRIDNVEVILSALKDNDGTAIINIFPIDFSVWNSFGIPDTDESKPTERLEVKTIRLDTFAKSQNIKHIDFLKIDVEGSEKDVFAGAVELLKEGSIDILSFEVSKAPLKGTGGTAKELFDILTSYGYSAYEYDTGTEKFIGPIFDSNVQHGNYYASRKDLGFI